MFSCLWKEDVAVLPLAAHTLKKRVHSHRRTMHMAHGHYCVIRYLFSRGLCECSGCAQVCVCMCEMWQNVHRLVSHPPALSSCFSQSCSQSKASSVQKPTLHSHHRNAVKDSILHTHEHTHTQTFTFSSFPAQL